MNVTSDDRFTMSVLAVSTRWQVLDVKIVSWLLDPDKPAATFTDIVDQYPKLKQLVSKGGCHIWSQYKKAITRKLYIGYNDAFRKIMKYDQTWSVSALSGMFVCNNVMSFNETWRKICIVLEYHKMQQSCCQPCI